ncbi:MAG TPA: alanine dehydrogenase, partial [Candidatus Wirthbacteria bacterium]|nr:alanine dehydrogenase [Candidatus Wirthbacteria bacterium]
LAKDQVLGIDYKQFFKGQENKVYTHNANGKKILLAQDWHDKNIIVNGILQDTDNALMFIQKKDLNLLPKGCLIIDVSCDEGMAFPFARPTSFSEPMFRVDHVYYYAVDHTPSYLWNSASWEISHALLPFLEPVMNGPKAWKNNSIINKAIEMQNGTIVNPKILSFQSRAADYPHAVQK